MAGLADLLRSDPALDRRPDPEPLLMAGEVFDVDPVNGTVRVTVRELDGAAAARTAFGALPDAQPGDEVRVMRDDRGGLVVVAWEPA